MFLRKIMMLILVLPLLIIFDNTRQGFAAKISNCSNCGNSNIKGEKNKTQTTSSSFTNYIFTTDKYYKCERYTVDHGALGLKWRTSKIWPEVDRLKNKISLYNNLTLKGIGDDCALLDTIIEFIPKAPTRDSFICSKFYFCSI